MKRRLVIWGLLLTVGGWLLFRFVTLRLYPEAVRYAQAGNLRLYWDRLTVTQKLFITGTEIPFFTGVVLLFIALTKLIARKKSLK